MRVAAPDQPNFPTRAAYLELTQFVFIMSLIR